MNNNRCYNTFSLISINTLELDDSLEDFLYELDKQLIRNLIFSRSHFDIDNISWSLSNQGKDYWSRLRNIERVSFSKKMPIYLKNFIP